MAYPITSKPFSLGKIAPTSGTSVRLTNNLSPAAYGNNPSSDDLWGNKIEIKADVGNSGRVFIGSTSTMNKTTFVNVIRALDPGEAWSIGDYDRMNVYQVGTLWVDVETTGDYCSANVDVI